MGAVVTGRLYPNAAAVYVIRHIATGREYIGSAANLYARWQQHINDLEAGRHKNERLQSAWRRHGRLQFQFEVLERFADPARLAEREQHHIRTRHPWFNTVQKVTPRVEGRPVSDATRRKLSEAKRRNLSMKPTHGGGECH